MAKPKKRKRKRIGKSLNTGDPQWTPFVEADIFDGNEEMKKKILEEPGFGGVWINSIFQVSIRHVQDAYTWLCIVRRDRKAVHDWRHLQRIKNELVGYDREAMELYPAESRLVDTNNQYHLFVLPEGRAFPFGYTDRDVAEDVGPTKHKQRPFEKKPPDMNARVREGAEHESRIATPNWETIDDASKDDRRPAQEG